MYILFAPSFVALVAMLAVNGYQALTARLER